MDLKNKKETTLKNVNWTAKSGNGNFYKEYAFKTIMVKICEYHWSQKYGVNPQT